MHFLLKSYSPEIIDNFAHTCTTTYSIYSSIIGQYWRIWKGAVTNYFDSTSFFHENLCLGGDRCPLQEILDPPLVCEIVTESRMWNGMFDTTHWSWPETISIVKNVLHLAILPQRTVFRAELILAPQKRNLINPPVSKLQVRKDSCALSPKCNWYFIFYHNFYFALRPL